MLPGEILPEQMSPLQLGSIKDGHRQCDHKATTKQSLAQNKRAVHEGVKYPCGQCDDKTTSKSDLTRHKRTVHKW